MGAWDRCSNAGPARPLHGELKRREDLWQTAAQAGDDLILGRLFYQMIDCYKLGSGSLKRLA